MEQIKRILKGLLGQEKASKLARSFYVIPNCLCNIFPMKDEILLESNPDFSCNTYELYRYFLKIGLNKKYRLVWRIRNPENYNDNSPLNVYYINKYPSGIVNTIKNYIRCNRAKVSISCNRNLPKYVVSRKQLNIYLDHGSQLKSMKTKDGQKAPLSCDYLISQSKFFVPYHLQEYTINNDQIVCTGLPRDDQFYRNNDSISAIVPEVQRFSKVVIWTPTFREHRNGYQVDCKSNYPYGLPFLFTEDDIRVLSQCLENLNILLIIKPHPQQNLEKLLNITLKNVQVVLSEKLSEYDIQINELLAQTDAMITDYSSIYYDYLFTEKPIALTLDDYSLYEGSRGFVFDNPLDVLKGSQLYSLSDLLVFLEEVATGIDIHLEERKELQRQINDYFDDKSSERVYRFLLSKLG